MTPEKVRLSIIVPIYGVEKYLHQCLDSIASQTFKDFECILVDDGSKDDCPSICDEYAARDARYKVIHKKNAGYGAAVNTGLSQARGEWIGIVEPDDWIRPEMYERLMRQGSAEAEIDVAKCWFAAFSELHPLKFCKAPFAEMGCSLVEQGTLADNAFLLYRHPSIWTCIYRKKMLSENGILMEESPGAGWQDNLFQVMTLAHARRISFVDEALYAYQVFVGKPLKTQSWELPFKRAEQVRRWLVDHDKMTKNLSIQLALRELTYLKISASAFPVLQAREFMRCATRLRSTILDAVSDANLDDLISVGHRRELSLLRKWGCLLYCMRARLRVRNILPNFLLRCLVLAKRRFLAR